MSGPTSAAARAPVPMTVVGGFLGAGKTTLLNRILAGGHGVRYAVLVNDFGALEVDGALVAAHDGDTVMFANGCLCCSMGDDLVGAIDRLLDAGRRPEHVLVEASGVADPAPIADVATLHPELARDRVVVLADAGTLRARHADPRLRETIARQLDAADLLVLNKCDCVGEEERQAADSWARRRARVPVIRAVDADVPLALLSAARMDAMAKRAPPPRALHPGVHPDGSADAAGRTGAPPDHDHAHRFVSRSVACPDPVDPDRLRAGLLGLLPRVLRAKGFVATAATARTKESWMLVQASGQRVEMKPWRPPPNAPAPTPGIVFIGLDDLPGEDDLIRAVRGAPE